MHEAVVDVAHGVGVGNGSGHAVDDAACVYFVVEEEGGNASFCLAVDDGPVDGGSTAVLRQQGGVEVEGAHGGHGPDDLGQHAEGNDDLEVGMVAAQLLQKGFVLQAFGLQDGEAHREGILLDGRGLQGVVVAAHGFVGHGDHGDDVIVVLNEFLKGLHGELGSAHEDDAQHAR